MASEQCEQFSVKKVFLGSSFFRFGSVERIQTGDHILKLLIFLINVLSFEGG